MRVDANTALAKSLMDGFAERTGLISGPQRRYLWTDAFAVCNLLGLGRATGVRHYDDLARRLVDAVHHALGRHRADAPLTGWLSGLEENDGKVHPTVAGLRIGKPLPERPSGQPLDSDLEWDRDGQYFHYLTKWMHALAQTARAHSDPELLVWACELADTAHRRFTYGVGSHKRMYWKMSIDLTRPIVPSMGQHDPLDGLVTCLDLQATASAFDTAVRAPDLTDAIRDFSTMIEPENLATGDPLGIGGLLVDAARLAHLVGAGIPRPDPRLLATLLAVARQGLRYFTETSDLAAPANRRLAFRELGLSIGLAALESIDRNALTVETRELFEQVGRFAHLRQDIEAFWIRPANREARSWVEHADINEVMLATSLLPDGFLSRA